MNATTAHGRELARQVAFYTASKRTAQQAIGHRADDAQEALDAAELGDRVALDLRIENFKLPTIHGYVGPITPDESTPGALRAVATAWARLYEALDARDWEQARYRTRRSGALMRGILDWEAVVGIGLQMHRSSR